jgi:hypothetical protein
MTEPGAPSILRNDHEEAVVANSISQPQPVSDPNPNEAAGAQTPEQQLATVAYFRVEPELAGVDPRDFVRIQVDIPKAVTIALGALPRIRTFREAMLAMPDAPVAQLDMLEDCALACWYAHVRATPLSGGESRVPVLAAEAAPLRERLLVGADALAHAGYFDSARVGAIHPGSGYLDLANDLIALVDLYREKWSTIESKTAVTAADVARADVVATDLIQALGVRTSPTGEVLTSAAADRRIRAFTLFARAYDACRRAIAYLRWAEDDVDEIVPTLFVRRSRRAPEPEPEVPTPVTPPNGEPVPSPAGPAPTGQD